MTRINALHLEEEYKFNVHIVKDGDTITIPQKACTKWHAIELAFTKYHSAQPDRSKYSADKVSPNRMN